MRVYLGYPRVANLHHYVANQLKNKQSGIQAAKVELILHVVIQDLPSTNHLLHRHTQKVCYCMVRRINDTVLLVEGFVWFSAHLTDSANTENQTLSLI